MEFESSTPSGYTAVTLSDSGRVWGVPTRYTNDSDPGTVAYLLLGKLKGCDFANAEADRESTVYIKTQSLGRLDNFESETVCRRSSSRWAPSWPGVRMTHLLFFDESSPTNTREGVYNPATGKIELSEEHRRWHADWSSPRVSSHDPENLGEHPSGHQCGQPRCRRRRRRPRLYHRRDRCPEFRHRSRERSDPHAGRNYI